MPQPKLKLLVDENIPGLEPLLGRYCQIQSVPGRAVQREMLRDKDVLLVRSVTQVDERLLAGTNVSWVGSATIGTDHIDTEYLKSRSIPFVSAPGSNASSVADYVCSALATLIPDLLSIPGRGLRAATIGHGNVGSLVSQRFTALGFEVCSYDPLLVSGSKLVPEYLVDINDALCCDVVSVHVPLSHAGSFPTRGMFDDLAFQQMKGNSLFINTSRGPVVNEVAMLDWLDRSPGAHAVLDVWPEEPNIADASAMACSLATAHIAGYSQDGKIRASNEIARQLLQAFELPDARPLSAPKRELLANAQMNLNELLLAAYDIRLDDTALRQILRQQNRARRAQAFDKLRRDYDLRADFSSIRLVQASRLSPRVRQLAASFGFQFDDSNGDDAMA